MLLERVRILHARLAGGCVADMGEEGTRADFMGTGDECFAAQRGHRLAVDPWRTVLAEGSQPDPVWLALTLQQQARRCVEQPEGCLDLVRAAAHAEEPAHGVSLRPAPGGRQPTRAQDPDQLWLADGARGLDCAVSPTSPASTARMPPRANAAR